MTGSAPSSDRPRLAVDVGGTFTDLAYRDGGDGSMRIAKVASRPDQVEAAVLEAIDKHVSGSDLSASEYFIHSTTVALNALLQRAGARTALLTTTGFRDVLETRRGDRVNPFDLKWQPSAPLVPRRLRIPIRERIYADGRVHTPLADEDVLAACEVLAREGVESVAIAFLHAYANPAHELAAAELLGTHGYRGTISLSHLVASEYREFERTSTTVVSAYIGPLIGGYLREVETELRERGFDGAALVTRSGGGALTFDEARDRAFETISSGPAAGAEAASQLTRAAGYGNVLCADVGGTSFDTCLIASGEPLRTPFGFVEDLPLLTEWIDVRSIGAGGGSIIRVDPGGLLRVGPQSAGAEPGPASYGRGGHEPTITDAAHFLGMLGEGHLSSGLTLDIEKARVALRGVSARMGMTDEEVASGAIRIAAAAMADAMRTVTIEKGHDPRSTTLLAFGGAGPLFATLLAAELEIATVAIPRHAGNFSTLGLLASGPTRTFSRTIIGPLSDSTLSRANAAAEEIRTLISAQWPLHLVESPTIDLTLDLRYSGQEHTIAVTPRHEGTGITSSPAELAERFEDQYASTYGSGLHQDVELVTLRVKVRGSALPVFVPQRERGASAAPTQHIDTFSMARRARVPFTMRTRASLGPDDSFEGPALVIDDTSVTYVDVDCTARIDDFGSLVLRRTQ